MLLRDEARTIALRLIQSIRVNKSDPVRILDKQTIERDFGWVFFYESEEYLKTGNRDKRLVGNAPVLVDRTTARGVFTGTGYEVEDYIDAYEALGPERYSAEANGYLRKKFASE